MVSPDCVTSVVDLIFDEWILLEYSCCFLGVQQNATVEAVSKSLSPEFGGPGSAVHCTGRVPACD
jgi:hypothetical protein